MDYLLLVSTPRVAAGQDEYNTEVSKVPKNKIAVASKAFEKKDVMVDGQANIKLNYIHAFITDINRDGIRCMQVVYVFVMF